MSLLSKSCVYGIRAVLYVATQPSDKKYVSIGEIAGKLGLSFHFLTKILQGLTEKGILASHRGPTGGVALARPARGISLMDIVEGIDGPDVFETCILGLAGCGERKPCPLHKPWAKQRTQLRRQLAEAHVADVARQTRVAGLRLSDT